MRFAVFSFLEMGELVFKVDLFPFEVEDFALTRSLCESNEDDRVEVKRAAFSTQGEEPIDFVWSENTVASIAFFEFDEIGARILTDPVKLFACITE